MGELTNYSSYREYKQALDTELKQTAEGFVRIGYLLKLARETDILAGSGYATVNEFAQAEYGLDKSQVSRFIHINDRFSEGGFSDCLQEQYQGMGYAKLALMLSLPDGITEELTPAYSKSEITAIKEEVEAEQQVTDIEVILEGQDPVQQTMGSLEERAVHQLLIDEPETFRKLYQAAGHGADWEKMAGRMQEVLAPNGEAMKGVRIRGAGRFFLSIKGADQEITLVNVRHPEEKGAISWQELGRMIFGYAEGHASAEEAYEAAFGEPLPSEKPEVAPVQPEKKPAQRKIPKVTKAKVPEPPKAEPVQQAQEEQLPGQTEITDFINMPEGEKEEDHEEQEGKTDSEGSKVPAGREDAAGPEGHAEDTMPAGEVQQAEIWGMHQELARQRRKEYETAIHLAAEELLNYVDGGAYGLAGASLNDIAKFLGELEKLPLAEEEEG